MQPQIVFRKCFQCAQTNEVVFRTKAYGLFDVWKASVEVYCKSMQDSGPEESVEAYRQLMLSCLQPLLRQKEGNSPFLTHDSDCCCLAKAAALLLQYTYKQAHIPPVVFTTLFIKTIHHCCHQPTDSLMLGEVIMQLIQHNMLTVTDNLLLPLAPNSKKKTARLIWNLYADDNHPQLPPFSYDVCEAFQGVKTPEIIMAIFKNGDKNLKIIVPNRHLPAVLVLCDLMVKARRLSCKGSHGYIQFLGNHIAAPEGEEQYNPNTFRLIKYRALDSEGEKITIKNQIKDLFFKYCPGEEANKIFKNYFS